MSRQEKKARRRRRGGGVLPALIALLTLVAAVLTMALIYGDPLGSAGSAALAPEEADGGYVDQLDATVAPLVLGGSAAPAATPEPTAAPTAEATPEPDATTDPGTTAGSDATVDPDATAEAESDSERLTPTAQPGDYFLPVYDRALRTADDEAMIAVTVDRCDDAEAMSQIVSIAQRYNVDLTLFPTGEALMAEGMAAGFRTCVRTLGYELENYTYSHKAEYSLSNGELALQLWKQGIAASYALDGDYEQHFYRPYSAYSTGDQRTHFFLRKLGLLGVAGYTHSYRDYSDAAALAETLESGNIYQFDMSEASLAMFEGFVSEANRKGYKMVTMNRLFALDENELSSELTIDQQTLPDLSDYVATYYDLKLNDRTNAVYTLQTRLMALGYLTGEGVKADGIYGASTSVAVSTFQAKIGVPATGNADVTTQQALYADDAPAADGAQ